MVPEDTGDNADSNEDITDGNGNLATGWCQIRSFKQLLGRL